MELKRKIYDTLVKWKEDPERVPLIVDGLRQVGKSFIVDKFARANYENVIVYDFRHQKELRKIFSGDLDVDTLIRNSGPYFPKASFVPYKTALIFEEIGDCPLARTSLKSFALDHRYDVLATGSLLGISNHRRKKKIDIPAGYEKIITMSSLDFEEFLWASQASAEVISHLRDHLNKKKELEEPLAAYFQEMVKRYIVVGGMPKAVVAFLSTNNYMASREVLEGLLREYRGDFGRFINDNDEEEIDYVLQARLNEVFSSIPAQLARDSETYKFKFADVVKGGRATQFEGCFSWLEQAGLVSRCFNVNAIETPLQANADLSSFEAFLTDIGLLMAMYPISTSQELLRDELDSRKGAIFENLVSTMLHKSGFPLYYFCKGSDHLEIDFLVETNHGLALVEEKTVNGKMAASRAVMEGRTPYKASVCYKLVRHNFGIGNFYETIPHYAAPFLFENIAKELKQGTPLPPLEIPSF